MTLSSSCQTAGPELPVKSSHCFWAIPKGFQCGYHRNPTVLSTGHFCSKPALLEPTEQTLMETAASPLLTVLRWFPTNPAVCVLRQGCLCSELTNSFTKIVPLAFGPYPSPWRKLKPGSKASGGQRPWHPCLGILFPSAGPLCTPGPSLPFSYMNPRHTHRHPKTTASFSNWIRASGPACPETGVCVHTHKHVQINTCLEREPKGHTSGGGGLLMAMTPGSSFSFLSADTPICFALLSSFYLVMLFYYALIYILHFITQCFPVSKSL